ncbi:hypothetical protein Q9L58_007308 [Maublancomyces gigas]|uniref:HlyIII-domain-containing protein n=1 Tax=Discina gigas TaxID=1032678 RepID=A0ABR3GCV6_9PEZI
MSLRQKPQQSMGEKAIGAVQSAEKKAEKALTVLWNELQITTSSDLATGSPLPQQANIPTDPTRPASSSFRKSFASLHYLHNETVNIYSHLLGAISFALIGIYIHQVLPPRYASSTRADILAFGTFFVSAAICLGMSATYHTISNHSHAVAKFGNKLDYLGIVVLIMGSFIPSVYYGFWCHRKLTLTYWSMISILGVGCATVSTVSSFRTPTWRPFRAAMFVAMGGSAVVPVIHGLKLYGRAELNGRMGLGWMLLEGALYISGATIYAARIPEKWNPGRYDLYGSSHQIFHFLVVAAAGTHLVGLVRSFDYLHGVPEGRVCL